MSDIERGKDLVSPCKPMPETISSLDKRLGIVEALVVEHLGKNGTVEQVEKKVNAVDARLLVFSGAGGAVIYILDHVIPLLKH
jgi:hypothetical protein